ncbi:MAG: hypothetical protein AAF456_13965 [Planctomycetota bacterium]
MSEATTIEQLKQRFDKCSHDKTRIETQLKTAQENLNKLKKEALEQHGSDDLKTLKAQLAEMKKENEARRAKYEQLLDKIESDLADIEEQFTGEDSAGE